MPSTPTASPATVSGRHVVSAGVRKTITVATSQASAPIEMTGQARCPYCSTLYKLTGSAPGDGH